jgi:hypothetical protein
MISVLLSGRHRHRAARPGGHVGHPPRNEAIVRHAAFVLSLALVLAGAVFTAASPTRSGRAPAAKSTVPLQPRFIPRSVSFVSPSRGWAWGPAGQAELGPGLMATTSDGGRSWTEVKFGS